MIHRYNGRGWIFPGGGHHDGGITFHIELLFDILLLLLLNSDDMLHKRGKGSVCFCLQQFTRFLSEMELRSFISRSYVWIMLQE